MEFMPENLRKVYSPNLLAALPALEFDPEFPPEGDEIGRILVLYDPDKNHLDTSPVDLVVSLPDNSEDSIRLGPYVLTRRDAISLAKLLLEAENCRYDDELETAECRPDPIPPPPAAACLERPAHV